MVCAIWRGVPVIAAATGFGAGAATFFASDAGTCSDATPPARPSVCIKSIDAAVPALSLVAALAAFTITAGFIVTSERPDVVVGRPTTVAVFAAAMRVAPIVLGSVVGSPAADPIVLGSVVGSPAAAGACALTPPSKHNARTAEIVVVPTIAPGAGIRLIGMSSFREQA